MRIRLVVLELSSWRGSIGGEHYYGKLECDRGRGQGIRVTRKISTKEEADYLSKKDGTSGGFHVWKIGQETNRFNTRQDVENRAKEIWRRYFPKHHALIVGLVGIADPQRPLDGDPAILKKLQSFWRRAQRTGGYEKNYKAANRVHEEFWAWMCGKKRRKASKA